MSVLTFPALCQHVLSCDRGFPSLLFFPDSPADFQAPALAPLQHLDAPLLSANALLPLQGMEDYLLHHPIQDAAGIFILYFTINALKAGASLPVAIVAGGVRV